MSGSLTISIEVELGWGMHDLGKFDHLSEDRRAEDEALEFLLEKLSSKNIAITFDVVGHLLLEHCKGRHGKSYPPSWWNMDPGTTHRKDPLFYAPCMIKKIRDSSVDHEICSHTFSHYIRNKTSERTLVEELKMVRDIHEKKGLRQPRSIVMPRHQKVNYSTLDKFGYKVIRVPITGFSSSRAEKYSTLLWKGRMPKHPPCEIRNKDKIVETTCRPDPTLAGKMLPQGQRKLPPYWKVIPRRVRENIHKEFLINAFKRTAKNGKHLHLWTHLYNISNKYQLNSVEYAINELSSIIKNKNLEVLRMCDIYKL